MNGRRLGRGWSWLGGGLAGSCLGGGLAGSWLGGGTVAPHTGGDGPIEGGRRLIYMSVCSIYPGLAH